MLRFGAIQATLRGILFTTILVCIAFFGTILSSRAALQFDVFAGYDSYVREGDWFPITFEVSNDGPTFQAFIEVLAPGHTGQSSRRIPVDLPTGTLKRISIPAFAGARHGIWEARLLTSKGDVVAREELDWQKLRRRSSTVIIMGAMCRTSSGLPAFPAIKVSNPDFQPVVARWQSAIFPDNPIALEGMDAFYLSSERALDLKDSQIKALLAWVQSGGHLIIGVDQIGDVNGTAWLRELVPAVLTETRQVPVRRSFARWMEGAGAAVSDTSKKNTANKVAATFSNEPGALFRTAGTNIVADTAFENAHLQLAIATVRNGKVLVSSDEGVPMAIQGRVGRGLVTLLTFSPERPPFTVWANKDWFWATLAEVPVRLYESTDFNSWGYGPDSVFGALIESTQIRKVPLLGLVALLVLYLVVIGPVDQILLKRANKQMLTWVTFPAYVLLFSALIYFIGFKLRSGESEYSELHVVDVLPNEEKAILRGRTYASIYSPSNERYRMKGEQFISALRGEYLASWGNGSEHSQAQIVHLGNKFDAEIHVPVWTSQLYVNDWWNPVSVPPVTLVQMEDSSFEVINTLERPLTKLRLCVDGKIHEIGDVDAKSSKVVQARGGLELRQFVRIERDRLLQAAESRQRTFGSDHSAQQAKDLARSVAAACFISQVNDDNNDYRRFVTRDELDLTRHANAGSVILLAWVDGFAATEPMNQFKAARGGQNTMLRIVAERRDLTENNRAN